MAIDIGHSASSPGAISARGVPEYNFNRKVAGLLLAKLRQDPNFRSSFIINEEGDRVSLSSRPAVAESRGADLFLSIHHDSVYPEQLSKWVYQGKLMDVCDEYAGYSVFYSEINGSPANSRRLADCHRDGDAAERLCAKFKPCRPGQPGFDGSEQRGVYF